ncbi:hypothetical protein K3495_g15114, partial [Podosphaera aphanis]
MALQAKLGRKNLPEHVFHDILGILPLRIPTDPSAANPEGDIKQECLHCDLNLDPEAYCKKCRHRHKNKFCYRLHPKLAPGRSGNVDKGKGKQIASAINNDSDSGPDSGGVVIAATSRINKFSTLYDTGASHHSLIHKSYFREINQSFKPFKFDQAIGSKVLDQQGDAVVKVGSLKLNLRDALFSPESSCNIISAGRLERFSHIVADFSNSLLVQKLPNGESTPVASLQRKNDVYYIHPLDGKTYGTTKDAIAAPGIVKKPTTSSAQRWNQRLGHVGQNILKNTAQHTKGLQGIDLSQLTTCETCHLSKTQRLVSREPRPIPYAPLDEIFIDTVGKITTATNGHQYAVIIIDSKTRMRWAITTQKKDQIAPLLLQWINLQHHQYGKRVRAIFRDGGTEFLRTKSYCE